MDEPVNAFDLSPEQQETASLLQRLLGSAIANRYVDFCRLAAGAFALNVSRPMAAHALRELDSMLRGALEVPMDARAQETAKDAEKIAEARKQLLGLSFEPQVVDRAARELKPRLNHKQQIRQIVSRLGLAPDGDIAGLWSSLTENFGRAHQRSFHRSLKVDDDFREQYQRPFDTVIRAVAVALQGRYVALVRRVEELAAMADRKQAAKLFAGEITGALPLQRHFFDRLQTADWLPHLAKQGLFAEPLAGPDEGAAGGMRFRQWPAGNYLLRIAKSADAATRHGVADALRNVGSSKHPDVQYDGLEILAALPPEEAAPLADLAVSWLTPGTRNWPMQTPETLIKQLAEAGQREAALKVARALLQIWEQNGRLVTHHARHMYEFHLPSLVAPLAACCGEDALRLFADLLHEAARITGRADSGHYSMRPMGDDGMAQHDVYESLISAVRRSAEALIQEDATRMRGVLELLASYEPKIFVRLYLHVLASNPAAAPDLARAYLTDLSVIGASWCRDEYSKLALAWFPFLSPAAPELRPCLAEEIARLSDTGEQIDREFRRERFADYLMALCLWGGLPDDLLESFWAHAPSGVRQHCMWYLGTQLPAPDMPDEMRARGCAYWERRLDAARRSDNPNDFRAELGAIGQWTLRGRVDDQWLADQLFEMLQAGFVPTDAYSVVDWLAEIAPRNLDRAVEILSALLRHPLIDQWAYMTQREPIRAVLAEGLARGTQDTIAKVHELIGFLSSINETSYIDLIRPPAAE